MQVFVFPRGHPPRVECQIMRIICHQVKQCDCGYNYYAEELTLSIGVVEFDF